MSPKNKISFPNLTMIDIYNKNITNLGFKVLVLAVNKFPNLQLLDVGSNKITSDGVKILADFANKFVNLKSLHID
jgi:hypothetical protein